MTHLVNNGSPNHFWSCFTFTTKTLPLDYSHSEPTDDQTTDEKELKFSNNLHKSQPLKNTDSKRFSRCGQSGLHGLHFL